MRIRDAELAIMHGLDTAQSLSSTDERFGGLLAVRTVCHLLLGTDHHLYAELDRLLKQNLGKGSQK